MTHFRPFWLRMFATCWLCIGTLPWVWGQVYNITRYTTADGLIQSQVMAMAQDHNDFLWLGTHGGLSRYDGRQFIPYTPVEGLAADFVNCLYEDRRGRIWIGSNPGLSRYDGREIRMLYPGDSSGVGEVLAITEGPDQNIWLGTNTGILILSPDSLTQVSPPWEQAAIDLLSVRCFTPWKEGILLIGTDKGLFQYENGTMREPFPRDALTDAIIYQILIDRNEIIWVCTDQGLFHIAGGIVRHMGTELHAPLREKQVYCLLEDEDGVIWIGTDDGVLRYLDGRFIAFPREQRMLKYKIRSMLQDTESNIWLGTDGGGVRKITQGVFRNYNTENGLSSSIAKSFLEDDDGNIWISTYDQGINVFDGNSFSTITEADGLGGNDISFSYEDREGTFWFASYSGGLTRYDGSKFDVFDTRHGLPSNQVYCIGEGYEGDLWTGTERGVAIMRGKRVIKVLSEEDGLPDNRVYAIEKDQLRHTWVGTANGVCRHRNGKLEPMFERELKFTVFDILADPQNRLWFATSGGLFLYDQYDFFRVRISGAPGAHNVVSLLIESDTLLWIGTENGTYQLNLNDFRPDMDKPRYEHYTQKDGLPSLECNANAIFLDKGGNLWIGTSEGAITKPVGVVRKQDTYQPSLHITDVRLSLEASTPWDSLGFELDPFSGLPVDLKLGHNQNRLVFYFIGISLKSPKQVEYKYKLVGLDEDWSISTRQTSVSYSNLGSGEYVFQVAAKNEAEVWNYQDVQQFSFTILPAYYESWWFWALMALLFMGIGMAINGYLNRERRRKAEEARVKNQAEKLQLEHQALYAMMNPHFTFNALQSIQYFIHRQDKRAANKFLSSFAKLVRKNLESTQSEVISLAEEVERLRLYLSLEHMRFPEKFVYAIDVDPDLDMHGTEIPPMILQPFVENSIKHGIMPLEGGGEIRISIRKVDDDYLKINIQDNGIGLAASKKRKEGRPNDHVSKGMQITKDRLALFERITGRSHTLTIEELVDPAGEVSGTMVGLVLPLHG